MPSVAEVSLKKDTRASLQKLMDSGAGAMRYVMTGIAFVITFGIIYNAARIARTADVRSSRCSGHRA